MLLLTPFISSHCGSFNWNNKEWHRLLSFSADWESHYHTSILSVLVTKMETHVIFIFHFDVKICHSSRASQLSSFNGYWPRFVAFLPPPRALNVRVSICPTFLATPSLTTSQLVRSVFPFLTSFERRGFSTEYIWATIFEKIVQIQFCCFIFVQHSAYNDACHHQGAGE